MELPAQLSSRNHNLLSPQSLPARALGIMVVSAASLGLGGRANAEPSSQVYQWGNFAASTSEGTPRPIEGFDNVVSIAPSNADFFALECAGGRIDCPEDGQVWAEGKGFNGDLGDGSSRNSMNIPVEVQLPEGEHAVSVGEAYDMGVAVTQDGKAFAWGANKGALCVGDRTRVKDQKIPKQVIGLTGAIDVSGGSGHVDYVMLDGSVKECSKSSPNIRTISGINNAERVSDGNNTTAILTKNNTVLTWGNNQFGQAGINSSAQYVYYPTEVNLPGPVKQVYAGGDHYFNGSMVAELSDGRVYGWGDNQEDQLGNGTRTSVNSPIEIYLPAGDQAEAVAEGGQQTFVLTTNRKLLKVGNNGANFKQVDSGVTQVAATAGDNGDIH